MTRRLPTPTAAAKVPKDQRASVPWATLALACVLATPATGHEFWIEPTTFAPQSGQDVAVRLFVGHGFDHGKPYARNPRHLKSFFVEFDGRHPIPGDPGSEPAGRLVAQAPGVTLVGYESYPSTITLEADRFEAYLRDEGLEHVVEERRSRGESGLPGREGFSRAAKSLLSAADASGARVPGAEVDRLLGLPVEIVPESDPATLEPGAPLSVVVLRHGAPLQNTQVRVFLRGDPEATINARTDVAGRASLPLGREGTWLVSVVHLERAPAGDDVDWLSTWSSLTFSTHRPSPVTRAERALSNPSKRSPQNE